MSSIMDKLDYARRWATRTSAYPEEMTRTEEALVDVIRAVEMLAMEREGKHAGALGEHGALPTANEIVDAWSKVPGFIVEHRAMLAVEMVRARVMPELASRDKRIAELEQAWDMLKKSLDESDARRNEGLAKIAELEKRLAETTAPPTVDGKTPGQVDYEGYTMAWFGANTNSCTPWDRLGSDFHRFNEAGAQAVLRAFGNCHHDKCPTGQEFVEAIEKHLRSFGFVLKRPDIIHWGVIDGVVEELFEQWRAESSVK